MTNPGDVAKYREAYPEPMSKKGLLIQLDMLGDALNLGVKHTTVNIPYHQLVGGNLKYKYNGKTYNFNGDLIKDYDKMISAFSAKGIVVTAILLNGWNDSYPELHEAGLAKRKEAFYYGFNVSTDRDMRRPVRCSPLWQSVIPVPTMTTVVSATGSSEMRSTTT